MKCPNVSYKKIACNNAQQMTVLEVAMVDETILLLFNADRIFNHPDPDVGLQTFSALCNELQIQLQLRRRRRLSACCGDLILRKTSPAAARFTE